MTRDDDSDLESTDDYQAMLDRLEGVELVSKAANDRLMDYRYAAVDLTIEEQPSM